jgi:hypothetical protein
MYPLIVVLLIFTISDAFLVHHTILVTKSIKSKTKINPLILLLKIDNPNFDLISRIYENRSSLNGKYFFTV